VDARIRHQVGLELGDIDVEGTIEAEGGSQRGDDLSDQAVQVGVRGALNVEGLAADVVDGLVVEHDGDVSVLQQRVGGQDGVVGLNDGGRDLGRRIDSEAELGLLAVVNAQSLQEQRAETGSSAATNGVEDEETLETLADISQAADAIEGEVDHFLANGVVATSVVVGSILLARQELLGVVELAVGTSADLIDDGGLQVNEDGAGDVLAGVGLGEEGVEGIIAATNGGVGGHLAVRLDAVLQAEELPARITNLDAGLADVERNDFTHLEMRRI